MLRIAERSEGKQNGIAGAVEAGVGLQRRSEKMTAYDAFDLSHPVQLLTDHLQDIESPGADPRRFVVQESSHAVRIGVFDSTPRSARRMVTAGSCGTRRFLTHREEPRKPVSVCRP